MNRRNWINVRMRALLAEHFCPSCGKHNVLHNDDACSFRYSKEPVKKVPRINRSDARYLVLRKKEDVCVSSVPSSLLPEQWLP